MDNMGQVCLVIPNDAAKRKEFFQNLEQNRVFETISLTHEENNGILQILNEGEELLFYSGHYGQLLSGNQRDSNIEGCIRFGEIPTKWVEDFTHKLESQDLSVQKVIPPNEILIKLGILSDMSCSLIGFTPTDQNNFSNKFLETLKTKYFEVEKADTGKLSEDLKNTKQQLLELLSDLPKPQIDMLPDKEKDFQVFAASLKIAALSVLLMANDCKAVHTGITPQFPLRADFSAIYPGKAGLALSIAVKMTADRIGDDGNPLSPLSTEQAEKYRLAIDLFEAFTKDGRTAIIRKKDDLFRMF